MIRVGQQKKAKYWGRFSVRKVARLKQPVECQCDEVGTALFEPTIVNIEWETPPSDDRHEFWFPYWITIGGKEKYEQFAPMIGEKALLELFEDAIEQGFFSPSFLQYLGKVISGELHGANYMQLTIDKDFVNKWSSIYDKRYLGSNDQLEEVAIRHWLSSTGEPRYLNKEYFVRLGRWKSVRVTKLYEANDEREITEITRSAYQTSDEVSKLNILQQLRGVGVAVAATILHYLQPDVFPIFDYHVRKSLKEAGHWTRGENDASNQAWLEYLKIMRKLSESLGVTLRELDKALFAYDKFRHQFP